MKSQLSQCGMTSRVAGVRLLIEQDHELVHQNEAP